MGEMLSVIIKIVVGGLLSVLALYLTALVLGERRTLRKTSADYNTFLGKSIRKSLFVLVLLIAVVIALSYYANLWFLLILIPSVLLGVALLLPQMSKTVAKKSLDSKSEREYEAARARLTNKRAYECKKCGKAILSLDEAIEYWGDIYCKTCVPDQVDNKPVEKKQIVNKLKDTDSQKTILLVDDDVHIRKLYTEEFSEVFGDKVKTISFRDGISAFDFFKENLDNVHLVISNILMPGIDGIEFLKLCKKLAPNIPFIICTSYDHNEAMQKATSEADAYIVKGADFLSELLDAVRKFLDSNMQQAKELIHAEVQKKEITLYKKGDFIGRELEVFGVLGMGGFGVVYLIYHHGWNLEDAVYAMKTLRGEYLKETTTIDRFKKEAKIWIDFDRHPYLVRAYVVEEIADQFFIVIEYIAPDENGLNSLDGYLKYQPPDLAQSLRWAIQFCHGMEYAYSKGIKAHRDIKPANIMITHDKTLKISDFGLAGVIGESKAISGIKLGIRQNTVGFSCQTMEGVGFGTPTHMPPEQFINAAGCDERSDIYSFGVVLYQMATGGKFPFLAPLPQNDSYEESRRFWIEMHKLHSQAPVSKLNSPLSPIIQKCLEKEPKRRYQSFNGLRSELEPLLKRQTGEVIVLPKIKEMEEWGLYNKGVSFENLGKHQKALDCYNQALKINPDASLTWYKKACAEDKLNRIQDAIASYKKFIEIAGAQYKDQIEYAFKKVKELEGK